MSLLLGMDMARLPIEIREEMEHLTAQLQTWAGKQDGAGKWTDVPWSAGYYKSTAGVWTVEAGDQQVFRYTVIQDVMLLRLLLYHTSTDANVTNDLRILIPGGYRATDSSYVGAVQWDDDAGAGQSGIGSVFALAPPNENLIRLLRDVLTTPTNWPINLANTFSVRVNLMIPVYRDPLS